MFNQKLINALKNTINNLEDDLGRANFKIECRDNFIKDYQEKHEMLIAENNLLKAKMTDLENNIELLVNNSKNAKIKELITTRQSNN